ncbi:MAG: hypothetical protein AAF389_18490 [Gemmatimonadota bacterium]
MNRAFSGAALLVALVAAPLSGQETTIFREIQIAPYGTISLGEPFVQADVLGRQLAEDVYLLPPGFGGTLGIAVSLDADDRVAALIFEYAHDFDFSGAVEGYRADLGEPSVLSVGDARDSADTTACVVWEDAQTRFEMYRRGDQQFLSMMSERRVIEGRDECIIPALIQTGIRLLPRQGLRQSAPLHSGDVTARLAVSKEYEVDAGVAQEAVDDFSGVRTRRPLGVEDRPIRRSPLEQQW